jgi:hypothetical protein
MNVSDPDPADTVFFDPDTPRAGEGFFYLKAVRDGEILRGLGVSSSGSPRVPRTPCS